MPLNGQIHLLQLVLTTVAVLWSGRSFKLVLSADTRGMRRPSCTTDVGGCQRAEGGCPRVDEGSDECVVRQTIQDPRRCSCSLSLQNFCNGLQPEEFTGDFPVAITYSAHNHQQYNVTATWQNSVGGWSFRMMLTDSSSSQKLSCACGTTNPGTSVHLTGFYNEVDEQERNIHLCLRNTSGTFRYLRKTFRAGMNCIDFVRYHHLEPRLCREYKFLSEVETVRELILQCISPSSLQATWAAPGKFTTESNSLIYDVVYYLQLTGRNTLNTNSSLETHNFSVSNSTNVTLNSLHSGWNYTVSVRLWIWCEEHSCLKERQSNVVTLPTLPLTTLSPSVSTSTERPSSVPLTTATLSTSTSMSAGRRSTGEPAMTEGTTAETTSWHLITGYVILGASAVVVVSILTLLLSYYARMKKRFRSDPERRIASAVSPLDSVSFDSTSSPHLNSLSSTSSQPDSDKSSSDAEVPNMVETPLTAPMSEKVRVIIASSLRSSTQKLAAEVAAPLASFECLRIKMYDVCSSDGNGEWQGTPSQWAEQALLGADFVVCICNKEFMEDWNWHDGNVMCRGYEASLVGSIREYVSRRSNYNQHEQVQRRFVVAVLHETDFQYVPERLRNCVSFVLNCDASYINLVRHLQGIPAVVLQQRPC